MALQIARLSSMKAFGSPKRSIIALQRAGREQQIVA